MKRILLHKKLNIVMRRAIVLCALVSAALLFLQGGFYVKNAVQAESENKYAVVMSHLRANASTQGHGLEPLFSTLKELSFSRSVSILSPQSNAPSATLTDIIHPVGDVSYKLGEGVTYTRPIFYDRHCISCHTQVGLGELAGQLSINYPLTSIKVGLTASLIATIVSISFVMFFCYWVFRSFIQNQIEDAFDSLAHKINQISNHDDLDTALSIDSDIAEVKQIEDAFNKKNQRLKQAYESVATLSMTDSLTGLYNRNKLTQVLQEEINRKNRYGTEFALVMMDLDGFKQINDVYGHDAGDKALVTLAELIKNRLRPTDTAVRLGGDEFMIVLSHVSTSQADQFAQSIQGQINGHIVNYGDTTFQLSTSVGVSVDSRANDIETLLKQSDKAMYANKAARKERMRARMR
ncbi:MAG: GGDEF domain-containing protein [Pontibacterium sp.]